MFSETRARKFELNLGAISNFGPDSRLHECPIRDTIPPDQSLRGFQAALCDQLAMTPDRMTTGDANFRIVGEVIEHQILSVESKILFSCFWYPTDQFSAWNRP